MNRADMDELRKIVKKSRRYGNFTMLDEPKAFKDMFAGDDIPCVQLHSTNIYGEGEEKDIVGFCGAFSWINGEVSSLDGDSYSKNISVIGYEWFEDKEGKRYLDILVDEW